MLISMLMTLAVVLRYTETCRIMTTGGENKQTKKNSQTLGNCCQLNYNFGLLSHSV